MSSSDKIPVFTSQGTRVNDTPPWMSYAASMDTKVSPDLQKEIDEYANSRRVETKDNQTKEELCRQKEINQEVAKEYQWLHPSEYADEGARKGKIMHSSTFINKLRNECGLKCWYSQHGQPKKVTLMVQRAEGMLSPEIACWCQEGFCTEYSIMNFDDHGAPLAEKFRGWRTPLLQMIIKRIIPETTVDKVFGKAIGPASVRYNSMLYSIRNTVMEESSE